jgi:hypothetical protein
MSNCNFDNVTKSATTFFEKSVQPISHCDVTQRFRCDNCQFIVTISLICTASTTYVGLGFNRRLGAKESILKIISEGVKGPWFSKRKERNSDHYIDSVYMKRTSVPRALARSCAQVV